MSLEVASSAQDSREEEHFELFTQLGFMQVVETEEGPVVVLVGKFFSWSQTKKLLPSLYRFVAGALEGLGGRPYTILYVHAECSYWQNSPGVRWLCSTYRRLPQACRDDLQRCYVLHADWVLSLAAATVCPWLQGDFWDKVSYVQLLEFLPPALRAIPLPEFVLEHDKLLTKQPLIDYGIVADPQETLLVPQLEPMLRNAEPEEVEEE